MKACACSDSRSWTFIRDDLDAPDRLDPPSVPPGEPQSPTAYPGDGSPESLPYPTLPPIPPAGGQTPAAPGAVPAAPAPGAAPAPARPARPAQTPAPRKAPEAKQSEDTTFF